MLLVVGEIVRPHGVRGEVVVHVRTDEPEERFAPGTVLITDPGAAAPAAPPASGGPEARASGASASSRAAWRPPPSLTVEAVRPHLGRLIVTFAGSHGRELAEALRRVELCVDSADLPDTDDPDEFHDFQLVGLTAVDETGAEIGEVVRIDHAPAADMLVLRRPDGRTALVPFVTAMVPEVDLAGGRVVVTPPEGLLDL
jgi:16S rRNA processing protein RimM